MTPSKILGGALALALVAGAGWGTWSLLRRPPRMAAPGGDASDRPLFQVSNLGQGQFIELQPQVLTPLRSVRWLPPITDGYAVAQVLTQADHQMAALFHQGRMEALLPVPKPEKVSDGFFRLAELRDAVILPDDAVILLYASGTEAPLALALDLHSKELRWSARIPAEHLALAPGDPTTAWAWGAAAPPISLRVAAGNEEAPGVERKVATAALPPEVGEISALIPTGPQSYLIAHRKGLSAWLGKAWTHQAAPAPEPLLGFYGIPSSLAASGQQRYWQPQPGQLMAVKADGSISAVDLGALGLPTERQKDAKLMRLRGADAEGQLWFDLAMPQLVAPPLSAAPSLAPSLAPPAPSAQAPSPTPDAPVTSLEHTPDPRAEWEAYLKDGIERLYRWKPGGKLELVEVQSRWKKVGAPPDIFAPGGVDLHPEAGGFLMGTDQKRWWLPLDALTR